MIARDLHDTLSYLRGISPVTQVNVDTPLVSQIINMADLRALEWVIMTGTLSDPDATFAVLMEESDAANLAGSNAVADEDMLPSGINQEAAAGFTFAADDAIRKIGYRGQKGYVRLTITPTGNNAGNAPLAVLAVGYPRFRGNVNGA